jgi:hypothetical protein
MRVYKINRRVEQIRSTVTIGQDLIWQFFRNQMRFYLLFLSGDSDRDEKHTDRTKRDRD